VSPTTVEVRGRLRLALRDQRGDPSPGLRFRQSELGQRLARGERLRDRESIDVVEDPWELRNVLLRSMADVTSMLELEADADRIVQVRPTPTALLPLCTLVPTTSVQIPTVVESSQVDDAGYAPDGSNLPGLTGASAGEWAVDYLEAPRVGRIIPVPLQVLDDAGQAEAVIDKLVTQNWRRAVENYVVAGNVANLTGITNTSGIGSVDATSTNLIDALASGVADVQAGGFYGPHAVVANPSTLKAIWTQKDSSNNYLHRNQALPTVANWVPAPGVPADTAIVCGPAQILVYLQGSFTVSITQAYLDFLARAMAAVKGEQRAAIWIRNPDAFVVVENL
jgi:HK97 family phage major capsid protein